MKPILKHRSISEMLTSALPPSPIVNGDGGPYGEDKEDEDGENCAGRVVFGYGSVDKDGRPVGMVGRPPVFHTKSDTNTLRRFGNQHTLRVAASANSATSGTTITSLHTLLEPKSVEEGGLLLSVSKPSLNGESSNVGTQQQQQQQLNARLSHSKCSSSLGNLVDLPLTPPLLPHFGTHSSHKFKKG
jgi:hypothetical protein